jgi:HTH-type transcriptional regulator, sugar sensing transcriptional regulator
MTTHLTALQSAGLSDKEASVYLALLQLSGAGAQTISTQAKVKRGTVYTILESLMKKGLVSSAEKAGKQLFFAEDPSKIEDLLAERRVELERTEASVRDTMGELRRLHYSGGTRPVVRYFEGEEGLKELLKEIRTSQNDQSVSFTDLDCLLRRFPGVYSGTTSPRIQKKRWASVLYTSTHGPVSGVRDAKKYREAQWVAFKKELDFDGDITIYENKVSITSFREPPVSILIEHEDITRLIRALFTLAWEGAEERGEPEAKVSLEDIDKV